MPTLFFKNFFLYFYPRFIKIFGMKGKFLTSLIGMGFCGIAYATDYVITSPSDVDLVPATPGLNLVINDGGNYSLSKLDTLLQTASALTIDFSTGAHTEPMAVLVADAGFDGTLSNLTVFQNNTQIQLTNTFMNNVVGDEVLRITNLTALGGMNVTEETDSGMYAYDLVVCSNGVDTCVKRRYSAAYLASQQNAQYTARVARIGVQNNPKMLLRPMTVITKYELLGLFEFPDETVVSVMPEYYVAKDFYNLGIRMNSGTKFGGRFSVGITGYVSETEFDNSVSDFKSVIYGGNLRFLYDMNDVLFMRGIGGFNFSNIDCDNVVKSGASVNNPNAFGVYGGVDFGAKFIVESGLYLSPFVGYGMYSESVVDVDVKDSFGHIGGDIGFAYFMDGVKYSYALRAGIGTNGYFDASVGIDVLTVSDKIGGGVSVGVADTDFGLSGRVAANVKFMF